MTPRMKRKREEEEEEETRSSSLDEIEEESDDDDDEFCVAGLSEIQSQPHRVGSSWDRIDDSLSDDATWYPFLRCFEGRKYHDGGF